MITTVFFDWGGVIASDPGDDFLTALLKQIGADDEQISEIFRTYMSRFTRGQISEADYWAELREHYGFEIHDSISDEFIKWKGLVANQDILALVANIKQRGMRVAVLTNVIKPSYDLIEQAGYYNLFDEVIASCKVGFGKPDQEVYDLVVEQLGVKPEECLFIDDKQTFLDPANRMGMQTLLARSPEQIVKDVSAILSLH